MSNKELQAAKEELQRVIEYGRQLSTKADKTDEDRAEMSKVNERAESLRVEVKTLQDDEALGDKISRIGRDVLGAPSNDVETPRYKDAVDAFLKSDSFKAIASDPSARSGEWHTDVIEFKAGPYDANATIGSGENPGDAVTHMLPGVVQPFVFPQNVGDLFSQGNMEGSSLSWVFVDDASGNADAVLIAGQKPRGSLSVDVSQKYAKKIATTFLAPEEALDDLPALESTLRNMMLVGPEGIGAKAEDDYINGNGTTEVEGVIGLSPDTTADTGRLSKTIFSAQMQIKAATGFNADAVVINPTTAFDLYTEEDGTSVLCSARGVRATARRVHR